MLPIAATVANHITLLGFDGKSPKQEDNEDFWGHSDIAQYHDHVDSGHQMHPTFDVLRQKTTKGRFLDSTETSIQFLKAEGRKTTSLAPSHTPAI